MALVLVPWHLPPATDFVATLGELTWTALHAGMALGTVLATAFGALATTSLIGYSPTKLQQLLDERGAPPGDPRREVQPQELLVVAIATTVAGWVLGWWTLHAFTASVDQGGEALLLALCGGALFVATGLPIALAQHQPERSLLFALPALRGAARGLRWPIVLPILGITRLLGRIVGARPNPTADAAEVQKQVIAAVADTVAEAALPHEERTWIGNIVGLKDLPVSTLMTPRPDIVGLPDTLTVHDAVQRALEHGFSRYPVYRGRIDEVVGVFYVKDALRLLHKDGNQAAATPLRTLLRDVLFVPETSGAAQLLRRFQAANQHLAIVIDEYGTTVGLVTVEDVLEQIVGDIGDEYDPPPASSDAADAIRVVESGRVLELPARATAAEVNRLLQSELPEHGDFETMAGLVLSRLNHIPAVGESVVIDGVEFRVLEADERRIRRLRATLLAPEPAEGAG
jgi:putative hemolysin